MGRLLGQLSLFLLQVYFMVRLNYCGSSTRIIKFVFATSLYNERSHVHGRRREGRGRATPI